MLGRLEGPEVSYEWGEMGHPRAISDLQKLLLNSQFSEYVKHSDSCSCSADVCCVGRLCLPNGATSRTGA
jgi:hypothetical protein